ncbi:hypothetical protein L1049_021164 [Liquidambar formosana]|uniref:CCHC-type domain-containing protein n=1 Tax=Liquidambar formosana TaxID=63359 RepID=A0AAP0S9D9_LIQFO
MIHLMWNVEKEVKIMDVGDSMIHVKFQIEFQMKKVIEGGPWMFDNHLLLLKRWERGRQVGEDIGRRIGEFIDVDLREELEEHGQFLWIRVDIRITKPLKRGGQILLHNGKKVGVDFRHERLPIFCYYCGYMGHDEKSCIQKYNDEKGVCTCLISMGFG